MNPIERFYDVLLSVYLYNEQRGYLYLNELHAAFKQKYPKEERIIASIRKHADDEHHHHSMFQSYFRRRHTQPFIVSSWYGYCDQMVSWMFGKTIDQLNPNKLIHDDDAFFSICRLIMITEMRGMAQVQLILKNPLIRRRPELVEIFSVVQRDEPSHCFPYQSWLRKHGKQEPTLMEHLVDSVVHYSLMFLKLPILYFNPFLQRHESSLG